MLFSQDVLGPVQADAFTKPQIYTIGSILTKEPAPCRGALY